MHRILLKQPNIYQLYWVHKTLTKECINYSGERFSFLLKQINVTQHETRRELLTPDELMRLPDDVAIIFKTGHSPIYGRKIRYYVDPVFSERSQVIMPKSDRLVVASEWPSSIKVDELSCVEVEYNSDEVILAEILLPDEIEINESLI